MARGPRRPPGTPPASRVLPVRVPEALREAVAAHAEMKGLTAGAVMRAAITAHLEAEPGLAVPVRRYRATRPPPPVDAVRLADLRHVTGEAMGTLRQVAGLDRDRGGARLGEIDDALTRLLAAAHAIDGWKDDVMRASRADEGADD